MIEPFCDRLRRLRGEAGLSLAELARRSGAGSYQVVAKWESGGWPRVPSIPRIAQALGVSCDVLLTGEESKR